MKFVSKSAATVLAATLAMAAFPAQAAIVFNEVGISADALVQARNGGSAPINSQSNSDGGFVAAAYSANAAATVSAGAGRATGSANLTSTATFAANGQSGTYTNLYNLSGSTTSTAASNAYGRGDITYYYFYNFTADDLVNVTVNYNRAGTGTGTVRLLDSGLNEVVNASLPTPGSGSIIQQIVAGTYQLEIFGDGGIFAGLGANRSASLPNGQDSYSFVLQYAMPEPSTWSAMIAGLSVTGFSLRRKAAAVRKVAAA